MQTELITDGDRFASIADDWNGLLSRSSDQNPFLTHEWQYTWWEHFAGGDPLRIVCVRDDGELVGIAAFHAQKLTLKRLPLLNALSLLGGLEADYHGFVLDNDRRWQVLTEILAFCARELDWHLLDTGGVRGDTATNYLLPVICARQGLKLTSTPAAVCPYVPLNGTGPDTWSEYGRRPAIREYRRKQRKFAREHDTDFVVHRGENAVEALTDFFRLHDMAWASRGGSKALVSDHTRSFHGDVVKALAPGGLVTVAVQMAEGQPIAARYGYTLANTGFGYLHGFDPELSRYSPGCLITLQVIDHLMRAGFAEMDLMRGEEQYKFSLTSVARISMRHTIAKSGAVHRLFRMLEALGRTP